MKIVAVTPREPGLLHVVAEDGRDGLFDVRPYMDQEAFRPLRNWAEFSRVRHGGYFVEWICGADLSADTIEARWQREMTEHD